ncbi:restriction system protein [Xanthomonas arboricola]
MGRRKKQGGFEVLAALPWPVGFVMGIAAYLVVRYGIGWWFSHQGGMLSQGLAQQSSGMLAPLAWTLLGVCWLAALFSYLGTRSRRRFLETRTSLESLAAGGWRQFERLVGEAFRRQGYSVEETGLGGADGGIDLILRRTAAARWCNASSGSANKSASASCGRCTDCSRITKPMRSRSPALALTRKTPSASPKVSRLN